ncbi:MAG TPA: MG2 domain-containing protein [Blastocatellia bacterium]|nr:MG2 domain-containing protein [Blastocatellia bacterium]
MRRCGIVVVLSLLAAVWAAHMNAASSDVRVDEAVTRVDFARDRIDLLLAVVNHSSHSLGARIKLEVLDPQNRVLATTQVNAMLREGLNRVPANLALPLTTHNGRQRSQLPWYRLRYTISSAGGGSDGVSGVISLSQITPNLFELGAVATGRMQEGAGYRVIVRAVHPTSALPISGVSVEGEISLDDESDDATLSPPGLKTAGVTGPDGYTVLEFSLPREASARKAIIRIKGALGGIISEAEEELRFDRWANVLLSTDKPLYQPGQALHVRALIFDQTRHAIAGTNATVTIDDPEGTTVFRAAMTTSRFGVASADWQIPKNIRLGSFDLRIRLNDAAYSGGEASRPVTISRYELPNFTVSVKPDRTYYLPGQNADVVVTADYLFGRRVARGHVIVARETERSWNYRERKWEIEEEEKYEGETDDEGRFTVHIDLSKTHEEMADADYDRFRDLSFAAYVTDPTTNRTEQRRFDLRVTRDPIHVYVIEGQNRNAAGFPLWFYLTTFYPDGRPARCRVVTKESRGEAGERRRNATNSQNKSIRCSEGQPPHEVGRPVD